jgi:predicted GNAT family acetyltransferase
VLDKRQDIRTNGMQYRKYILKAEEKERFFKWCLKNKLFKANNSSFTSRMNLVYTGFLETKSLTAVVAFENEMPIGLMMCENHIIYTSAKEYLDTNVFDLKIVNEYDWGFYNLGMINVYVKAKYRRKGVAKNLWLNMEELKIYELSKINKRFITNSCPIFEAQDLAFDIIAKYSKYSYVTNSHHKFYGYKLTIDLLTKKINYGEKKGDYIPNDWKLKKIKYYKVFDSIEH